MNDNKRAENFLMKSLKGITSEAEIDQLVWNAKKVAKMFNTKFSEFISYFLKKFSQIIRKDESETYRLLLGESN